MSDVWAVTQRVEKAKVHGKRARSGRLKWEISQFCSFPRCLPASQIVWRLPVSSGFDTMANEHLHLRTSRPGSCFFLK